VQNGVGEFLRLRLRQAQHVKGQPLGGLSADARQPGELLHQFFKRRGEIFHRYHAPFGEKSERTQPRSSAMRAGMSAALYTALPATSTLAPAAMQVLQVTGSTPPSTSSSQPGFFSSIHRRMAVTLGIISAMNFWPPKPGSTVITSTSSTSCRKGRTASAGVFGFSTTPARLPLAWILAMASWILSSVSDST